MWRPRKVSQGNKTPSERAPQQSANGEKARQVREKTRPTIVTTRKGGQERRWGPLSRANAWRAGCFVQDMKGDVQVFLEKDGVKREVQIVKRVQGGREVFWLEEIAKPQQREGDGGEGPTQEQAPPMQEDTPEEVEARRTTSLMETVTSLEKENEAMKTKIQEMEAKMAQQDEAARMAAERHAALESALAEIVGNLQQQIAFSESVRASLSGLVEEVQRHQDCFKEVVRVLQNHEQHISTSGLASQEMAQYINALAQANEKNAMWIADLMRETNAQSQVIREQHVKQHVLAEVMKRVMVQVQQESQQSVRATQVTVADADDETIQGFPTCPSPNASPPNTGPFGAVNEVPQIPTSMEIERLD